MPHIWDEYFERGNLSCTVALAVWDSADLLIDLPFCYSRDHSYAFACTHVFLVACTRLYNPLCPSVGPSVGPLHFTFLLYVKLFLVILSHVKSFLV